MLVTDGSVVNLVTVLLITIGTTIWIRRNIKRLTQREWQEGLAPHEVAIAVQKPLR